MNAQEIQQLHLEMKKLEKMWDEELSRMKTALENRISTLDKMQRPENFKWDVYFTTLAKELGQKFFLADKISQILRSRGKPYQRAKNDALELNEQSWNKANKVIERNRTKSAMDSDEQLSSVQFNMLTN